MRDPRQNIIVLDLERHRGTLRIKAGAIETAKQAGVSIQVEIESGGLIYVRGEPGLLARLHRQIAECLEYEANNINADAAPFS